ncbi:MAG TPA: hypothetical protein VMX55_01020 [candidate division Zixibacteria bacterium]|nr:hypothetical protein [candidate division Zixibacteria bacterium]
MEVYIIHSFEDVTKFILYQQLFLEPNLIRDRRSVISIPVEGSEKIIGKMYELILSDIYLWEEEKEEEYIALLAEKIDFDVEFMLKNYYKKLQPLQEEQLIDRSFKFLLLLSEIIKEVQDRSTKKLIISIEKKLRSLVKKKEVTSRLDDLSQISDTTFSLLINLRILNEYAAIVNLPTTSEIFNVYFEKVIQLIKR